MVYMGWSAMCDCGISYLYLLAFLNDNKYQMAFNISS